MTYRRAGRSGLKLPAISPRPVAQLRRRPPDRHASATSSAAPSTSASPTSTWPTTTARRPAAPRPTSAASSAPTSRHHRDELVISTKAGYHMWNGPYGEWGSRKYLVSLARPVAAAPRPRLRRHLLPPPPRPGHPARGDHGRPRRGRPLRQGPLRRHQQLHRRADRPGRRDPAGTRHPAADPPAVLLDPQPLDREGPPARHPGSASAPAASRSARCSRACSPTATSAASPTTPACAPASSSTRATSTTHTMGRIHALNDIAKRRGQSLAQLALAWALRDPRMTSLIIGASSVEPAGEQRRRPGQPRP